MAFTINYGVMQQIAADRSFDYLSSREQEKGFFVFPVRL